YHRNGNHYYLTYPVLSRDGRSQNYRPYLRVQSINDLSSIADVIEEQVAQRCQRLIPNPPEAICNPLSNLAPEFVRLIQDASNAVAVLGDSCQEITRYIELHDRIAALDSRTPVQIE